jgi:hypothetical protein
MPVAAFLDGGLMSGWNREDVLITVKTYPTPSKKYIETVCTAGITSAGRLIRLFPVPFRLLADDRQFAKYQWVSVAMSRSSDARPESFKADELSLVLGSKIGTRDGWMERRRLVLPHLSPSIESLIESQAMQGTSLGLIKPARVKRFYFRPSEEDWTASELAKLKREDMFRQAPAWTLQKLPYEFVYEFDCDDERCNGHRFQVFDWEVGQSYRKWSRQYGDAWFAKMHEKYFDEIAKSKDIYFFVGTIAAYPKTWTIVGLFYPPPLTKLEMDLVPSMRDPKALRENGPMAQLRLPLEAEEANPLRSN